MKVLTFVIAVTALWLALFEQPECEINESDRAELQALLSTIGDE